jgi:hypothetical protein
MADGYSVPDKEVADVVLLLSECKVSHEVE